MNIYFIVDASGSHDSPMGAGSAGAGRAVQQSLTLRPA